VPRLAAIGIGVAVSGAFVVTGGDLRVSGRAFGGDVLAVLGGVTAAAYVTVSAEARRTLSANVHTAICFMSASVTLLVIAVAARTPMVGFSAATWGWILALTAGAQLLGHAVFNIVLKTTSATVVSVSILFEIVGASLLAWAWFGERPPVRFVPAALLVALGAVLVVRAGRVAADVAAPVS
jgi:drug/metabolite transporter (DMT)-like permease